MDHPLIQHKITQIRDKNTGTQQFRKCIEEIATLMGYEALRDLPLLDIDVETPIEKCKSPVIAGKKLAIVPILRAGLGMVSGIEALVPTAKVGHIGLYRDPETHKPVEYYCKLPADCDEREVFVVDPMLATGGSAIDAVKQIKTRTPRSIRFMCLIAAPEGIALGGGIVSYSVDSDGKAVDPDGTFSGNYFYADVQATTGNAKIFKLTVPSGVEITSDAVTENYYAAGTINFDAGAGRAVASVELSGDVEITGDDIYYSVEIPADFDGVYMTYDLRKTPGYGFISVGVAVQGVQNNALGIGYIQRNKAAVTADGPADGGQRMPALQKINDGLARKSGGGLFRPFPPFPPEIPNQARRKLFLYASKVFCLYNKVSSYAVISILF